MSLLSALQLLVARFSIFCFETSSPRKLISTLSSLQTSINLELVSSLELKKSILPLLNPLKKCICSDDLLLSRHTFKLLVHIHSTLDSKTMFPLKDILAQVFKKLSSQNSLARVQAFNFLSYLTHIKPHEDLVSFLYQQISDQTSANRMVSLGILEDIVQVYPEHLLIPHLSKIEESLSLASADSEENVRFSGQTVTEAFLKRFPKSTPSSPTPSLPRSDTVILEYNRRFELDSPPTEASPVNFFDSDDDLFSSASSSTSLKRTRSISIAKDVPIASNTSLYSQDQRYPAKKLKSSFCSKLSASKSPLSRRHSLAGSSSADASSSQTPLIRTKSVNQSSIVDPLNLSSPDDTNDL